MTRARRRVFLSALAFAFALVAASEARSEPTPQDRALATELFQRGRERLNAGRTAEACEDLEASQRLDPSGGTILNLAVCHEAMGRTATAWSEFAEALSMARRDRRDDRASLAAEHIASLGHRLSRLTVLVDAETPGLAIVRDGSVLPRAAWGSATPIDPGVHVVEARAPSRMAFRATVEIPGDGAHRVVHVPALRPALVTVSGDTGAPPARSFPLPAQIFAIGAVASFAVGSVSGIHAIAARRSSDDLCDPRCGSDAVDFNDRAKVAADVSTAAFTIGALAAAAALYFFLARR